MTLLLLGMFPCRLGNFDFLLILCNIIFSPSSEFSEVEGPISRLLITVDDADKIILDDGEPFNLEAFVLRVMSVCIDCSELIRLDLVISDYLQFLTIRWS